QVLFKGANFQAQPSDEEIFYDCNSAGDGEMTTPSCKSNNTKPCDSCNFNDPVIVRATLERAAQATHILMQNFEQAKGSCKQPCSATLEITARLIPDPKSKSVSCRLQGRPITVQMPLEFDPKTGHLATKPASNTPSSVCHSGMPNDCFKCPGKKEESDICADIFGGSCVDSVDCPCGASDCRFRPIPDLKQKPMPMPVVSGTEEEEESLNAEIEADKDSESLYSNTEVVTAIVWSESEPEPEPAPPPPKIPEKRYFLALPQHKDFPNCAPCRFDPSPIMDEEGNVFCPGNCGCCQCAWRYRSFKENREHVNIKVCRCVQRGTIFTTFDQRENCSQTSGFDFCPCREKAEAKFLQLYNCEMWSSPTATRGREVRLDEITEIAERKPEE
ncbi:hypothetical protein KR222_000478, partial [Zaprionus bogoriensis]